MVRSRSIDPGRRRTLQRTIGTALAELNRRYGPAVAARFVITVGDEFQGLLRDASVLPEVIRTFEVRLPDIVLRLGIGYGSIDTDLREDALGMDGPAWHAARAAIEDAKKSHRLGGVFVGFGDLADQTLNGLARVLYHVRSRLTPKQRTLLEALLGNQTQTAFAAHARVSKQAVSKQARAAGWEAYREAESALRAVLITRTTEKE